MGLLEKNLSTLTTLPEDTINCFSKYLKHAHSHDIATQMLNSESSYTLDIFEGTLLIQVIDDEVKYKFIPSTEFNDIVCNTIITKKSSLVEAMSDKLKNILSKTFKDVL